jgi:hypothetical protein
MAGKTLSKMRNGETLYAPPWAIQEDRYGVPYLRLGFKCLPYQKGYYTIPVDRTPRGFNTYAPNLRSFGSDGKARD